MRQSPSLSRPSHSVTSLTVLLALAAACQPDRGGTSSPSSGAPGAARSSGGETPTRTATAATVPALFAETRIAETFKQATHMVIAPDGRIFVAEQPGVVRIVKNDVLLSTPFVTIPPADIDGTSSRGLMGITLSPSFATDRYVYLAYTRKSPLNNRIIRVRASANPDVAETTGGAPTISASFDLSPQGGSGIHNSMAMRFSGGLLYVSTGDNGTSTNAQNVDHSAGKVLRMNPDLTPAAGNPYGTAASANNWKKRLWGKGLRNPWTMAVHPTSGLLYVSDVGSQEGGTPNGASPPREEINNILTTGSRATEIDYGWPNTEGSGANIIHTYRNALGEDVPDSDCAVVGGTFYQPNATAFPGTPKFPASYNGAYFFGDHCSGSIKYLPAGQQTPQTLPGTPPADSARAPVTFATQTIAGLVQIEAHPDGSLYYLTRAIIRPRDPNVNGILMKVAYSGSAVPETCALTAPANGTRLSAPASVTLNADAVDSAAGIARVEFFSTTSNVPGAIQQKLGEDTTAPYSFDVTDLGENAYRLVARCSNPQGGFKDSDPITITVNGPTAIIDNPVSSLTYNAGDTINFSGSAFDVEDGSIPASRYLWIIELGHGVGQGAHFHESLRLEGQTAGSYVVSRNEELDPNVFQRINLQVQDSAGIYHTVERDIFPNKTMATVTTSPAGLTVAVDGIDRTGPTTFQSVVGMERALAAPATQNVNGRAYQFVSWSHGGGASQTWIVPNGNPTLTAVYEDVGPVWTGTNLGNATGGSFTAGSTMSLTGAGSDIYGTADNGYFVYRNFTGDVEIIAQVTGFVGTTNAWTKAGVMMREGLSAGARNVFTLVSPTAGNKWRFQVRNAVNGSTSSAQTTANSSLPSYVRVTRVGNTFTGSIATSASGPWTTIGTTTLALNSTLSVGLAFTSHINNTLRTGNFDGVTIKTPAPPQAPPGLNATAGNAQVMLSWGATSGATSYTVKRASVSGGPYTNVVTGHTSTSFTNTGLTNGATYYYVVSASNANGESGSSNEVAATPQLPPPPPVPANLVATAGNAQVNLSWSASSGATGYNIKRATDAGGPYTTIVSSHTSTSYSNTGLDNGTAYHYVVSALGAGGESGNSTEASATPQLPPPPAAPTNLQASPGNAQVNLTWTASIGATSYNVKRSTTSGGGYTTVATGVGGTSFNNSGVSNGTTYFYVVTAVNGSGESGNSNEASTTPQLPPPPAPPTNLQASAGNTQVTLTWTASSGATSYTVKRATVSGGPYSDVVTGHTSTSYTNTGLTNGTNYFYVVSATGAGGQGGNSTQVQATPTAPSFTLTGQDIGSVGTAGSYSVSGAAHTVRGSGVDVWNTTDEFHFAHRAMTGDGTFTARVTSLTGPDGFAKAGVMMRDGTGATARNVFLLITPTSGNGFRFQRRTAAAGTTSRDFTTSVNTPPNNWVRLVRAGNLFRAYHSEDGTNWTKLGGDISISMPATIRVGLAVTSHLDGQLAEAVFDSVAFTQP